jgi:hypothetical protein
LAIVRGIDVQLARLLAKRELESILQQRAHGEHHVIGAGARDHRWRIALHLGHDIEAIVAHPIGPVHELKVLNLVGERDQHSHRCVDRVEATARLTPDAHAWRVRVAGLH